MSNFELLNKARVSKLVDPIYGSDPSFGFTGFFCLKLFGSEVKCIACDQGGWQHVSVSVQSSSQPPSWAIMCKVKDLFWEPEDCVVQYHPPRSQYINCHPGVLHLWRSLDSNFPMPPKEFV